ncbi:hypothetical protein PMAYCL1PPCAC_05182, partial [Pristionchus mayeri]
EIVMVVTLPLHFRIVYVLTVKGRKLNLDPSFRSLMINSRTVNIMYFMIFILVQEPASAGVFFEFYKVCVFLFSLPFSLITVNSTLLILIGGLLHLFLGLTRLTAIALPLKHAKVWSGRRMLIIFVIFWIFLLLASIPLCIPGSTAITINPNVFGSIGIEFALLGNYFMLYSV